MIAEEHPRSIQFDNATFDCYSVFAKTYDINYIPSTLLVMHSSLRMGFMGLTLTLACSCAERSTGHSVPQPQHMPVATWFVINWIALHRSADPYYLDAPPEVEHAVLSFFHDDARIVMQASYRPQPTKDHWAVLLRVEEPNGNNLLRYDQLYFTVSEGNG